MGELVAAKLPVPPGFVLLRDCYRDSMRAGGVDAELTRLHREAIAERRRHDTACANCASGCRASCRRRASPTRSANRCSPRTARSARTPLSPCAPRQPARTARRLVRRHERDHHQRQRRGRRSSTRCFAAGCRCSRPRVDHLPRQPRLHRRSRHGCGDPADDQLREGRRRVHRRPEQRRAGPGGHRGRVRTGRGRGVRRGRARHLHRLQGNPRSA